MKNALIVALLILLVVGAGIAAYVFLHKSTPASPTPNDPFGFVGGNNVPSSSVISVPLSDGSAVSVPDFTQDPQPVWASAENGYEVGGSDESTYHILFYPEDHAFLVSLLAEPLGESRREAEEALRARLQLSNDELCKLRAQVATTIHVNESYAGQNLGLSFCPGAVKLP